MKKPTRVERKKRRKRIFFNIVLMLSLMAFATAYAFKSDFFNIEKIHVDGNNILSDDIIIKASGIKIGENILRFKKSQAVDGIKSLSYIKETNISQKLPDTININILEREPVVQIKVLSSYLLLDKEGFIVEVVDKRIEKQPSFVGFNIENLEPGDNIIDDEIGRKLFDFINEDDLLPTIHKINTINYDTYEEINIDLNSGISVAFGPMDNVKYKLRLLDRILNDIEKRQLKCKMIIMNKGENPILVLDN